MKPTIAHSGVYAPILVEIPAPGASRDILKRGFDLLVLAGLAPVAIPLILLLAALAALDGAKPFFGHQRIGRNGQVFRCWKIRTMVRGADARLAELLARDPAARDEWAACRKLTRDPRVTWFGGFLRRSSLDELPQLWNVLCGEMSLVGPRPITADELTLYGHRQRAYLDQTPGVTGLWQVSGRSGVSYAARVALDVDYAARASLALDLRILMRTVGVVLARSGV